MVEFGVPMDEFASTEEVAEAITNLSTGELLRLWKIAHGYARDPVWRKTGRDAEDLRHEALLATLDGTRRWKKDEVDLVQHLAGAMRSIRSNWRRKRGNHETWNESDLGDDGAALRILAGPDQSAVRRLAAEAEIDRIREELADDDAALLVIDGWSEEMSGPEISAALGISPTEFASTVRRLRRKLLRRSLQGKEATS